MGKVIQNACFGIQTIWFDSIQNGLYSRSHHLPPSSLSSQSYLPPSVSLSPSGWSLVLTKSYMTSKCSLSLSPALCLALGSDQTEHDLTKCFLSLSTAYDSSQTWINQVHPTATSHSLFPGAHDSIQIRFNKMHLAATSYSKPLSF